MKTTKLDNISSIYLRQIVLSCVTKKGRGHIGPALSMIEILRVLYDSILKNKRGERDRFILISFMDVSVCMLFFMTKFY